MVSLPCEELYFLICYCFFKFDLTCDFQGREQFVYWRNPQVNALLPTMYFTTSWRKRHRLIHRQCWGKTPKSYHKLSIYGVPSWCTQNPKPLDLIVWHRYNGFFGGGVSWVAHLPDPHIFPTLNLSSLFKILSPLSPFYPHIMHNTFLLFTYNSPSVELAIWSSPSQDYNDLAKTSAL